MTHSRFSLRPSTRCAVLSLLFSLTYVAAARAEAEKTVAAHVEPNTTDTVTIAQLVVNIPKMGDVGYVKDGYRISFLTRMRELGYSALGAEDLAFGKDESDRARFVIGGTLNEFDCETRGRINCRLGVEWKVMDRKGEHMVYQVQTRAHAYGMSQDDGEQAKALLDAAFERLLARPKFVAALASAENAPARDQTFATATVQRCKRAPVRMPGDANQRMDATVVLKASQSFGSGVVISPDGIALTAAHVVEGKDVTARYRDGSERKVTLLRADREQDIALVRIEDAPGKCVPSSEREPSVGSAIFAVGAPESTELSFSLSQGIVSGSREFKGMHFLQTDASVNAGHSGGPLLDDKGQVAAIISWKVAGVGVEGLSFGVPLAAALETLGVKLGDRTDEIAPHVDEPVASASLVVDQADPKLSVKPARWPWYVRLMRTGGLGMAATGGIMVGLDFMQSEAYSTEGFGTGFRVAGFTLLSVGVAAYITHFFLRPGKLELENAEVETTASRRPTRAAARLQLAPTGMRLRF